MDRVSQDSMVDAMVFASDHPNGVDPSVSVEFLIGWAALLFGDAELRDSGVRLEILDWRQETFDGVSNTARTRGWAT